jgi:hypothetical protein
MLRYDAYDVTEAFEMHEFLQTDSFYNIIDIETFCNVNYRIQYLSCKVLSSIILYLSVMISIRLDGGSKRFMKER